MLPFHLAATAFMTGLIWFVQVVHYPLFARVGETSSMAYAHAHQRRTTWVVAPVMVAEALVAVWIAVAPPPGLAAWMPWAGLALLAVIWASTALLQVPMHARLARGWDAPAHKRLVATNWMRTAAWSLRTMLALAML